MLLKGWGSNADFLLSLPLPPIPVLRENLWTTDACQRIENYACSPWASVWEKKGDCFYLTPHCCSILEKKVMGVFRIWSKVCSSQWECLCQSLGSSMERMSDLHVHVTYPKACILYCLDILCAYYTYFCVDSSGIIYEEKLLFRSTAGYTHLSVIQQHDF